MIAGHCVWSRSSSWGGQSFSIGKEGEQDKKIWNENEVRNEPSWSQISHVPIWDMRLFKLFQNYFWKKKKTKQKLNLNLIEANNIDKKLAE